MRLPKPRIRKPRESDSDEHITPDVGWYCTLLVVGAGDTPGEAYRDWKIAYLDPRLAEAARILLPAINKALQ